MMKWGHRTNNYHQNP